MQAMYSFGEMLGAQRIKVITQNKKKSYKRY